METKTFNLTALSENTEQKFYEILKHKISIQKFERWVYESEIESELPHDIYVELISLNYKSKFIFNELERLIGRLVDKGKFEIKKLKATLKSIINRDENCAASIEMTYDLYCSGYTFLRRLGLTYGLLVSCPPAGNYLKTWDEITTKEQNELLEKLYPDIIADARNALKWLENDKIIIKDTVNELGNYEFEDLRTKEEVLQGEVEAIDLDKQPNKQVNKRKSSFWSRIKNWWRQ